MHEAVACADRGDTDPDAAEFTGVLPRLAAATCAGAKQELAICRQWKIELLPRASFEPLTSDVRR